MTYEAFWFKGKVKIANGILKTLKKYFISFNISYLQSNLISIYSVNQSILYRKLKAFIAWLQNELSIR
jgi:hypothetical protein